MTTQLRSHKILVGLVTLGLAWGASAVGAVTLDSVSPDRQSVYNMVTLRGTDFGLFSPGNSGVVFESPDGSVVVPAGNPYVWRDDFIQVRVPSGTGGVPIPLTELVVKVETATMGDSNTLPFQVLARPAGQLVYVERSDIVADADVSGFLGDEDRNKARTKDADIADANGDGYPDIIDNNSNNSLNGTHAVFRANLGGTGFQAIDWEPINSGDTGQFMVTIPQGGNYVGDSIVYDADFVDLNNDELPEWVQAESGANLRLRVIENDYQGVPGNFIEATDTWLPSQSAPGSPDDVSHSDLDYDGFVDVVTSYRFSRFADVYINDGGQNFESNIRITGNSGSMHDVFVIDANADGYKDLILVNEDGDSQLFVHNGNLANPDWNFATDFGTRAHSGIAGDFNADGFEDFVLTYLNDGDVYLNDPGQPGNFTLVSLPDAVSFVYDIEPGDFDLDGDLDLIGASVTFTADDTARFWQNDGDGTSWTTWEDTSDLLPGIGGYQRLSADLIDFDLDGDMDFYLAGSDGTGPWGFGASPNQFWENLQLGMRLEVNGQCPGPGSVRLTGAAANGQVGIFGSSALGIADVGPPCAGRALDLDSPSLLTILQADGAGEISLDVTLGDAACDFIVQAVDPADCSVSNFSVIH